MWPRVGRAYVDDVVITAERTLDLRRAFLGVDHPVPVLDGRLVPYVNLDNAASTPALRSVVETVTGLIQPVHRLAEKVYAVGGRILVDAAQLAAHGPIDMRVHDDPGHLDFVALSAHMMYAPFGTGALVGCRDRFGGEPDHAGGGTIRAVRVDDVGWADLPEREEAGSPNVVGAGGARRRGDDAACGGLDRIAAHEVSG
jgi:selenocysteine lyase/cysteine desulfurase